jgi:hypothetical protein
MTVGFLARNLQRERERKRERVYVCVGGMWSMLLIYKLFTDTQILY